MNPKVKFLTLAALLIAVGVLLPMVFHMLSFGGPMFLPMHLPVLIAGFLLPWQYSALVGIATPLLSSFITGMPPLPTVFTMTAELFTYGITTSLLYRNFKKNTYVSIISAMLIGRLVSILANWILFIFVLGLPFKLTAFLYSMFVIGLPGIVIQILTIPPLVTLLVHRQANVHERSANPVTLKK